MGYMLALQHVEETKSGWRYRRRWPKELAKKIESLGYAKTFVKALGNNDDVVRKNYDKADRDFAFAVALAKSNHAAQAEIREGQQTAIQLYEEVKERIRQMGFDPDKDAFDIASPADRHELDGRGLAADGILEKYIPSYQQDALDSDEAAEWLSKVPARDLALIKALNHSVHQRPNPTIEDAKREYIKHKGYEAPKEKSNLQRVERVVGWAKEALGGDFDFTMMRKQEAKDVLTYLLEDLGQKSDTADRYMNVLRAMVTFAIDEFDCDGVVNKFNKVHPPKEGVAKNDRRSFTEEEIVVITNRIESKANTQLQTIWKLMEGTGCRLSEIVGLRTSDVVLQKEIPFLRIESHDLRRLKTSSSVRSVPLVGVTLEIARKAVREAGNGDMLLSDYTGGTRDSDRASQALMKHVRALIKDKKAVVYSLRHTMKDRLRLAEVPKHVQDEILGHSHRGVGEDYGGERARLEISHRGLTKALEKRATRRRGDSTSDQAIS